MIVSGGKTDLKRYFEYRDVWMGLGILLVVFYHSPFTAEGLKVLGFVKKFGYGGVDLLILSSGLGCYYSLAKRSHSEFYLRRLMRVGPIYWLFLIPWTIYKSFNYVSLRQTVGNIFFVQYLTKQGGEVNWYVTAMWIYYLLAPVLRDIAVRRRRTWEHLAVILLMLLGSMAFWRDASWLIMVTRIPLFYLGMALGDMAERGCVSDGTAKTSAGSSGVSETGCETGISGRAAAAVSAVSFLAGFLFLLAVNRLEETYLWTYGLWWYPFLFIAPPVCFFLSRLCINPRAERGLPGLMMKGLSALGQASYGIFLVHILFFEVYKVLAAQRGLADSFIHRLLVFLAALLCGMAYDRLGRKLYAVFMKKLM